jgi:hypothetical protein
MALAGLPDEPVAQGHPFLQCAERLPERLLDALVLGLEEGFRRIGMTRPATEAKQIALLNLPEDTPAVGTRDDRIHPGFRFVVELLGIESSDAGLLDHLGRGRGGVGRIDPLAAEPAQQLSNRPGRGDVIDLDVLGRVSRHVRAERFRRVLDDGQTPAHLHGDEPGRAVIERSGKHSADDPWTVRACGAPEEHVDRRTMTVFGGTVDDAHDARLEHEVKIGRRDVDASSFDRLAVLRNAGLQRPGPIEDVRKGARLFRRDVQHDEDGGRQIRIEVRRDPAQRLDASGRRAEDHDISCLHAQRLSKNRTGTGNRRRYSRFTASIARPSG